MSEQPNEQQSLVDRLKSEGPSPHAGDDAQMNPSPGQGRPRSSQPDKTDEDLISRLEAEGPSPHTGDDVP